MTRKFKLILVLSAFLLSMCRSYDQNGTVDSINGLSCQNYTEYGFLKRSERAACFYVCPDGTVTQPDIAGNFSHSSALFFATKKDLDSQFCGVVSLPTATQQPASTPVPATALVTSSPTATSTTAAIETIETAAVTAQASHLAETSATAQTQSALLTGNVTMCDQTTDLISFRMVGSAPDLTDRVVTVQISEQGSTCAVNPVNTSLLTCTLPNTITFPATVVVNLDGAVVNDFQYDGIGCILVDTPIPP
ncbi:MAG: hypothetical protein ABIQ77_07835 [Anaerolineales bacterium]